MTFTFRLTVGGAVAHQVSWLRKYKQSRCRWSEVAVASSEMLQVPPTQFSSYD